MRNHPKSQQHTDAVAPSALPTGSAPQTTEKKIDHRKLRRTRRPPRSLPDLDIVVTEKELCERIPLDRQTIRRMVAEGRFPAPIQLTRSKKGWIWSRVLDWLSEREQHPVQQRAYFGRDALTD